MPRASKSDNPALTLTVDEARRLLDLSVELSDLAENILEGNNAYSEEFLRGLKQSQKEAREGEWREFRSADELLAHLQK